MLAGEQGVLPDPRSACSRTRARSPSRPTRGSSTPSASARPSSPPATNSRPAPSPPRRPRTLEKAANKASEGTSEGRYLFVTASFDPDPVPPPKPRRTRTTSSPTTLRLRRRREEARRREQGGQGEGREAQGRTRRPDRRRPEAGQGTDRPLRRLVLRHAGRQLPDDRPGPGEPDPRQVGQARQPRRPAPAVARRIQPRRTSASRFNLPPAVIETEVEPRRPRQCRS